MSYADKIAREEFLTEALRAANDAIGDEEPTEQALRIIAAIKALRSPAPVALPPRQHKKKDGPPPIDYLDRVQTVARAKHRQRTHGDPGNELAATAGIDTPIGRLTCTTWRRTWDGARGQRLAWASEYSLNGEPITVAEIKKAGLAQRPSSRNRQKKEPNT